jgi:type VI secretion system secreted protein VgrG
VENIAIQGSQTWSVGGNEAIGVQNQWAVGAASQAAVVGGNQDITINATGVTGVGSETVLVGAALIEAVGNPASGLGEFVKAAAIAGAGEIPGVGPFLSKGLSWGSALYNGYKSGGWHGVAQAAEQTALGEIAGQIPGGDAIVAAADAAGITPWSEKAQQRAAAQAGGGGGSGPGGASAGAAAAAPGHRNLVIDGVVTEAIGAVHGIQTPGSLKWTTLGAATFDVGASHSTAAVKISRLTMAASADTASATSVTARSKLGRNAKAAHSLSAGGAIEIDASGEVGIKAKGALTVQAGGAMSLEGGTVVFEVPGASVSVHGGGLTLAAPEIVINGKNVHSGKLSSG